MTKIGETVKMLRSISADFENGNDGACFDICGKCKSAADLIEQLDKDLNAHMQYNRNLRIIATNNETRIANYELKILKLQAENEQLKTNQPIHCKDCIHYIKINNFDNECGITGGCVCDTDFCSNGKRLEGQK